VRNDSSRDGNLDVSASALQTESVETSPGAAMKVQDVPTPGSEEERVREPAEGSSLWKHRDFLKLWSGQSASLIGSQVTLVALPLVAVTLLKATSVQLGLLSALGQLPYLLVLFFGVWADRTRRRPVLIAADLIRGVLVAGIPLAAWLGGLSIGLLYVVIFVVGLVTTIFDVSWSAYLPTLVPRASLPEANSKMQLSTSTAQVSGPGLVAALLTWLSAAATMGIDSASYFVSAAMCLFIRQPETMPYQGDRKKGGIFSEIWVGLRLVFSEDHLRTMLLAQAILMFFLPGIQALYSAYAYRDLGVPASGIALILMLSGPGAILGSLLGTRIIKRIGLGRMCVIAALGGNTSYLFIPFAVKPLWLTMGMLGLGQFIFGFTMPLGGISMITMRQALTPNHMQGRVTAAFRGFSLGIAPIGALTAGFLGAAIGLRPTILIDAVGALIPLFLLFFSPIPKVREVPKPASISER
jgi:MFS family permease